MVHSDSFSMQKLALCTILYTYFSYFCNRFLPLVHAIRCAAGMLNGNSAPNKERRTAEKDSKSDNDNNR